MSRVLSPLLLLLTAGCPEELTCPVTVEGDNTLELMVGESSTVSVRVDIDDEPGTLTISASGDSATAVFDDGDSQRSVNSEVVQVTITCDTAGFTQFAFQLDDADLPPDGGQCGSSGYVEVWCTEDYTPSTTDTTTEPPRTSETYPPTTTEPLGPTEIPPGTHDCDLDSTDCLVDPGSGCSLVLDELITSDEAAVTFAASVPDGGNLDTSVSAKLYASIDEYYGAVYGPGCTLGHDELTVVDDGFLFLDGVPLPGNGPREAVVSCNVDTTTRTVRAEAQLDGAPDLLVAQGELLAQPTDQQVVIEVRGARLCGVELEQP